MQPQQQMQVQVNHRNPKNLPVNGNNERTWNEGLFGCFSDMDKCCLSCWCPCIAHGKIKQRYEALESNDTPATDVGCCSTASWCYFLLGYCGWGCFLDFGLRGDIRRRYHIEGGMCGDLCVSYCCHICNQVQQSREIEAEEQSIEASAKVQKF